MIIQMSRTVALAATKRAVPIAVAGAMALSACVPIPYPSGMQFMPNRSDLSVPIMDEGGCGFGPGFAAEGYREFGTVRVSAALNAPDVPVAGSRAALRIEFSKRSRELLFQPVSFDPSLVRLEEAGQS